MPTITRFPDVGFATMLKATMQQCLLSTPLKKKWWIQESVFAKARTSLHIFKGMLKICMIATSICAKSKLFVAIIVVGVTHLLKIAGVTQE